MLAFFSTKGEYTNGDKILHPPATEEQKNIFILLLSSPAPFERVAYPLPQVTQKITSKKKREQKNHLIWIMFKDIMVLHSLI